MVAVDANVPLRIIVGDDARQCDIALALIASNGIYLLPTVVLEVEWVLRSRYKFDRRRIADALAALFALPGVDIERRIAVEWAIGRYKVRGEFADLLHLACVPVTVDAFATFDAGIAKDAGTTSPVVVRTLASA
ncbi:type II toxin-antitoxin system VapC family toxin [Sphingomonas sp. SUN039]|uniref:type II toxin-antitoxin system VapC family toxin n=1 Tax=Sphingomonas sp. SUN039 TaxID=2937787 RepID=UPI002164E86C|nr:type II toxin-antitoxin system VapC family toxin [Sphingomonas sp. SUN039]UVO55505.1 type II toxin-antitoxin system VapC family toxin [Sphingomonas sp. SUN039]